MTKKKDSVDPLYNTHVKAPAHIVGWLKIFKDTYPVGLGAYYRVAQPWLLMLGWAYDSSPISTSQRSPALPLDRQLRYAAGVQYEWNKDVALGLAYTLIDAGEIKVDETGNPLKGDLKGKYDPNIIHVFNPNFIYRF